MSQQDVLAAPATPTVASALIQARARGIARLDAQVMLARLLGCTRTRLIAHDKTVLDAAVAADWRSWLDRRAAGVPLAYLLGEKEFRGLLLEVTPDVLVPRPETELLVDWADEVLSAPSLAGIAASVADLGTGSGAIALAVKHAHPQSHVVATDSSATAIAVAQRNAVRLALEIEFVLTSWWQGLADRRVDLVLSNPPYIDADDPALPALSHEPRAALTPGSDGMAAITEIIAGAPAHLRRGGWLIVEHGWNQAPRARACLEKAGFVEATTRRDLAGHERATGARLA